jgi:hypothetical protein
MVQSFFKLCLLVALPILLAVTGATSSLAQGTDPNIPPATELPTQDFGNATQTGTIGDAGDGNLELSLNDDSIVTISEDVRNQGFVGATATRVRDFGFVGAAADLSGPPLAPEATFGGGVNNTVGGGGGAGGRAAVGQGFGAAGTQNGFSVTRQNLRARLVPSFSSPTQTASQVVSRFNNDFYRLPIAQEFSGEYEVSVNQRTATITGSVRSPADADRLIRQLRLQPGIYHIDNQLRIGN